MARPAGQGAITKVKVADEARKLFEIKGYSGTSMAEIRDKTGLSKGTIYHHFENKEELFLYCVSESSKEWLLDWERQSNQIKTVKEKLYLLGELYASDVQAPLTGTVPEFLANSENEQMEEIMMKLVEPEREIFKKIIEEGIRNKEFRSDLNLLDTATVLYSTMTGLASSESIGYNEKQFYQLYKHAITLFLLGVTNN